MPETKSYLDGYITVPERIAKFYELFAQGRLVTTDVRLSNEPDGVPRVLVEAAAYRTPDDPLPGRGWSWMILPGTTNFTRGSELENTETSAWGRAIAALGILTDAGVATTQEIQNKEGEGERQQQEDDEPVVELLGRAKVTGTLVRGTAQHFVGVWREGPKGHAIGFRLKRDGKDKDIPQVLIGGTIGETLFAGGVELLNQKVTLHGHEYAVRQKPPKQTYYRLVVGERPEDFIETSDVRIPPLADPEQDAVDAVPVAPGQEPLFDPAESARIDEAEAARA